MLDQSLLQSHFIGRDGFRWWIGQIAPLSSMGKQIDGGGWGNRFKVRIIGYHPYSEADLPNEDLPWAQALIPTTAGSGAANVSTGVQLQPGDIVLGFFLDGDNAQIPVILATFGRSISVPSVDYSSPFVPFTGFSNIIPKGPKTTPLENNENTERSLPSPQSVTPEQAEAISKEVGYQVVPENEAIGDKVPLANTVKNTQVDKIKAVVRNLLKKLRNLKNDVRRIADAIRIAADNIVTICNDFIGGLFNTLIYGNSSGTFPGLIGILKKGLELLFDLVYNTVLAATGGNIPVAYAAGVAAQKAMLGPIKFLEESFSCIAGEVIEKIKDVVSDMLYSVVNNVDRFVTCAAEQFVGTLLDTLINTLEVLFEGPLAGIEKLLQFFSDFNIGNVFRDAIGLFSGFGTGFGCNQNSDNFKGLVNEWTVGGGSSGSISSVNNSMAGTFGSIQEITNLVNSGANINDVKTCFTDALQIANPPTINIFGGLGSGCTAIPIFGNIIEKLNGTTTASVIGVQITNPGSGYTFPPFVEIVDDADQGYGAFARATINSNGEVDSIYIISEGENYSLGNIEEYSVLSVIIENGGSNYEDVIITDNLGNEYNSQIVDGKIYQVTPLNNTIDTLPIFNIKSNTGNGAILRPVLGAPKFTGKLQTVIDCPN